MSEVHRPAARTARVFLACSLVCTLAVALAPVGASAQITKDEAKCRFSIAKLGGKVVKTIGKAVTKCHKGRNKGTFDVGVDCNDPAQADIKDKLPKAVTKLEEGLVKFCASTPAVLAEFGRCPTPEETVDDGGATDGIDDLAELADCIVAHATTIASETAADVLGTPDAPLTKDLAKCHDTLAKSYTKYIDTIVKFQAKCQKSIDKLGGPIGFDCVTADPKDKISKTAAKLKAKIVASCEGLGAAPAGGRAIAALTQLGACAADAADLADCAIDEEAAIAGIGTSAMMWELPGICPGAGLYTVSPVLTDTELDAGWSGLVHDMDPILGYRALDFVVTCDPDCNSCTSSSANPAAEACRCDDDPTTVCSTNGDCGGTCRCYFGPPTPFAAGGTPACVVSEVDGTIPASFDPATGDMDFDLPLRLRIYLGISPLQPCPLCVAGTCEGGERDGLACNVDASDATFGDVSYGCPPSIGSNLSGAGLRTTVEYSTGSLAIGFDVPCSSPYEGLDCACATCTTDSSIVCRSDADCTAAPVTCSGAPGYDCTDNADCASADIGPCHPSIFRCIQNFDTVCSVNSDCTGVDLGTCTNTPVCEGGSGRQPNACSGFACTADVETGEGYCSGGPLNTYCDGQLRSNGDGIIPCFTNGDCDVFDTQCGGGDCGDCTLGKLRECFLDPIEATGSPGASLVGVGCLGTTSNPGVNLAVGLPGPYRVRQNLGTAELKCSDGVTDFIPPGGSNCP